VTTGDRRPIRTVLVAGRGEIARRIFRACRELGLASVAIYSDPDAGSVWSRKADLSIPLHGTSAAETYLNIGAILAAAREVGADAIHPGYGFLSENADFAQACAEEGFVFIGPPAEAIRVMGDKIKARKVAEVVGVPIAPGVDGLDRSGAELSAEAAKIGYPVLVKASAGGGGRGMRLVHEPEQLADALESARAEAASVFGDAHVFLERYFDRARHVEVQVLGDGRGRLVHLFERECSIQRRHQKIIEESPSPAVSPATRRAMTDAALALARAVDYENAGTVEFLLDEDGRFYFLEMNTRLQVEHPVTEMVADVDLAAWQIRIAGGEALDFTQDDVTQRGHAIECRVYAEDPALGFLPSAGRIAYYRAPGGPGVRCDDGVASGSEVGPYYDALLAKVIAFGWDRGEALRRLAQALSGTVVLGVTTNIPYLQDIVRHPAFRAGETHTHFLDEHMAGWSPVHALSDEEWLAVAAFESLSTAASASDLLGAGTRFADPWAVTEGWRNVP
jgi:acetyl-CoA carboxylase biotin carboxylase subunit